MSPYRVPAPPPVDAAPRKGWPATAIAAVIGVVVGAGVTQRWIAARDAAEREAERAQIEAAERNAIASELSGHLHGTSAEERAALEAQLESAKRRQQELLDLQGAIEGRRPGPLRAFGTEPSLPECKCAAGDPLCSEIPGATCRP